MKRYLVLTAIFAALCLSAAAAPQKRIVVSTPEEFINALGSDRVIVINAEELYLTPFLTDNADKLEPLPGKNPHVCIHEQTDGPELHIVNMKNLTIEAGTDIATILTEPRYANVISFDKCTNLELKGVTFGHTDEGYCDQGVLGFYACSQIKVDRCDLFGCGTEGIIVEDCENAEFIGTKIRDCSYYIMHLYNSSDVTFKDCQFFRNREFSLVNINTCTGVTFHNCMFANNTGTLFNTTNTIYLYDCVILHQLEEANLDSKTILVNCITEEFFNSEQALG